MSTMTFLEQQQEVASRLRFDTTNTNEMALVQRWLNQSQQEIWGKYDWAWAREREIVQTVIDISTGTVSVSSAGTLVTGSGTAWSVNEVGKFIQFQNDNDWYKITAVNSATSLSIEAGYIGTANLSGGTYNIRKMFYNTTNAVEKVLDMRQVQLPAKLVLVPFRQFDLYRPYPTDTATATMYIPWSYDSSARFVFSIFPTPSNVYNLEIRYKKKAVTLAGDTDVSLIPEKWHSTVMIDGALYRGLEYVRTNGDDRRAEAKFQQFKDGIEGMVADADPESDYHPIMQNSDRFIGIDKVIEFPGNYDRNH